MTAVPRPPFFRFSPKDPADAWVFDKPQQVGVEPPEFEEYGPYEVFDADGRLAELAVEGFDVVIKGWSDAPDWERFDERLRPAATIYLPHEGFTHIGTPPLPRPAPL